ncbi:MAG: 50S ribosomal protein L24 [Candidatus Pacearchaeota archaeon]|nr:50S ribosomal protein L24 [Candidatus Pacearchaeota archaeon]
MKKFSTMWISSKKPRKQRKYRANAPNHIKRDMVSSHLSKELRKVHGKRSLTPRKGDTVKIMRGSFKRKSGKIARIDAKNEKIFVEGMQKTKKDGSKISIPFHPSNLLITELNTDDKKRLKTKNKSEKDK